MERSKKLIVCLSLLMVFILVSSLTAFAASTVIVYNGDSSSGWSGSGTFQSTTSCGYDGSMYYQNANTASAGGEWILNPTGSGYDNYYVYIPSCHSSASTDYECVYSGNYVNISVDQSNYSNQWVYLGNYYVAPNVTNAISTDTYAVTTPSFDLGFDEAKFTN